MSSGRAVGPYPHCSRVTVLMPTVRNRSATARHVCLDPGNPCRRMTGEASAGPWRVARRVSPSRVKVSSSGMTAAGAAISSGGRRVGVARRRRAIRSAEELGDVLGDLFRVQIFVLVDGLVGITHAPALPQGEGPQPAAFGRRPHHDRPRRRSRAGAGATIRVERDDLAGVHGDSAGYQPPWPVRRPRSMSAGRSCTSVGATCCSCTGRSIPS